MDLQEYLNEIKRRYGVRRITPDLDASTALKVYKLVADAMLDWKGSKYDYQTMKPYVDKLMSWAICDGSCGLDLNRGILFKGATGRGKTFMLQIFAEWLKAFRIEYTINGERKRLELTIANARTIANEYARPDGGSAVIQKYASIPVLVIDDIGAESREQNSYGNKVNVINDILDKRQELNKLTFGTTNFDRLTAEAGYDDRMKRRINALFNIISLNHDKKY